MVALIPFLALAHLLGAALGCAGITFAEIFYLKATADGRIDQREKDHIRSTYWAMRWGLSVTLIAGFLLTIAEYQIPADHQLVMYAALWMQDTLAVVIIFAGWALAARFMPWWLSTALAFSAWWMILLLESWQTTPLSYGSLASMYVIFAAAMAIILGYLRTVFHPDDAVEAADAR